MDVNWGSVVWEFTKTFGPAFLAWLLAVWTAKRNASKDWEKVLKQLELTKQNNAEVQNHAYKLQFCLTELEKKDRLYEELISEINIVIQSTHRFRSPHLDEQNVMVISSANIALNQLHIVMFNTGSLFSLIKASKADYGEFSQLFEELERQGENVERVLHFLITGMQHQISVEKFDKNYDPQILNSFNESLMKMQRFIMDTIMDLFKEMD